MRVEVYKSDVKDFLWLQNALEDVLIKETLRRAIANNHYEKTQEWLYKEDFSYSYGIIEVKYCALKGETKYKYYCETYTLIQALHLAFNSGDISNESRTS